MENLCLPVCYFPTTVLLVGDSMTCDTESNFNLANLPYIYQVSTATAAALVQQRQPTNLLQQCFAECLEFNLYLPSTHAITFNVEAIHDIIYNAQRFREISVVIIDQQNIQDSLEFSQQIKSDSVQKLLLFTSGQESLAIAALSKGDIDYCINKQAPDFEQQLQQGLELLRYRYFQNLSRTIIDMLTVTTSSSLKDPFFKVFFQGLCEQYQIVEFYLIENSGSYLLFNSAGKASCLIVKSQQDIYHYYELAMENQAPETLVKQLKAGKKLPYFWQSDAYYSLEWQEWKNYLYPAKKLQGHEVYFSSFLSQPPLLGLQQQQIVPYQAFLAPAPA